MEVRKAVVSDAALICSVCIQCWRDAYSEIFDKLLLDNLGNTMNENGWHTKLESEHNIYVVLDEEKIIGFASFSLSIESQVDLSHMVEIKTCYVNKKLWGLGVGDLLLKYIEKEIIINIPQCKSIII